MSRSITAQDVKKLMDGKTSFTLLDLRRRADFDADASMVAGARWLDHEHIAEWSGELPCDREIVLYCAHGRSLSNDALYAWCREAVNSRQ